MMFLPPLLAALPWAPVAEAVLFLVVVSVLFLVTLVVLPPLLMLVARPPLVADAVPPELPFDEADWLVVFVLVLYDPFTLTLLPLLAAALLAPEAVFVVVLVLFEPLVTVDVLALFEPSVNVLLL